MAKNYNLGNKADMRRFERDLKIKAGNIMQEKASSMAYTFPCPHCKVPVSKMPGKSICPFCKGEIKLGLDFK
jgi:hypothetical protein